MPNIGVQLGGVADPFGGALAPVFLVGHHGRRTGDEDRPVAARAGRALAFIDGHDFDFGMAQAGGATYLVGVTTIVGLEGGIGIAGLDDQDWGRHKNVVGIQGKHASEAFLVEIPPAMPFEFDWRQRQQVRQPFIPKRRKMHADDKIFTRQHNMCIFSLSEKLTKRQRRWKK
jgi:hypothetical protein